MIQKLKKNQKQIRKKTEKSENKNIFQTTPQQELGTNQIFKIGTHRYTKKKDDDKLFYDQIKPSEV